MYMYTYIVYTDKVNPGILFMRFSLITNNS